MQPEPMSVGTWIIHILSVSEWYVAMYLAWRYAAASGEARFRGLALAMLPPAIVSPLILYYHAHMGDPDLRWIVNAQAIATLIGNITLALAALKLWDRNAAKEA